VGQVGQVGQVGDPRSAHRLHRSDRAGSLATKASGASGAGSVDPSPDADPRGARAVPQISAWVSAHRRTTIAGIVVVAVALALVADWPHKATASGLRSDYADFSAEVQGDVQSCGLEVEQTLSAYNQIVAGVSTQRDTAAGIANQTALDCTPMGSSEVDDLGSIQAPRSLAAYNLDAATQQLYAWCYPGGVDVAQDLGQLLTHPGDAHLLNALKTSLSTMYAQSTGAQHAFDAAAASLGTPAVPLGLDAVRPSVLVG
jgi:hypothetical protein